MRCRKPYKLRQRQHGVECLGRRSLEVGAGVLATQAAVWMYSDHLTYEMSEKMTGLAGETIVSRSDWDAGRMIATACGVVP